MDFEEIRIFEIKVDRFLPCLLFVFSVEVGIGCVRAISFISSM